MKIGLMSDSHDNVQAVEKAMAEFGRRELPVVMHCGDMVAPPTLQVIREGLRSGVKFYFVYGNNDGERVGLWKTAERDSERCICLENQGILELAGKRIFITHESAVAELMARNGQFDYCFGGHDHQARRTVWGEGGGGEGEAEGVSAPQEYLSGCRSAGEGQGANADEQRRKRTIFVNPGNLTIKRLGEFYKSDETCVSVVDLETGEVEKIAID